MIIRGKIGYFYSLKVLLLSNLVIRKRKIVIEVEVNKEKFNIWIKWLRFILLVIKLMDIMCFLLWCIEKSILVFLEIFLVKLMFFKMIIRYF